MNRLLELVVNILYNYLHELCDFTPLPNADMVEFICNT